MLEVALAYLRRGWNPVPIVYRGKRPIGEGWQLRRITVETAPQYFNGAGYNIGLQLGAASGGLTDVDLDCAEAIAVASYVLPATKAIFGRQSKRASHRLYVTELCRETDAAAFQLRDPRTKGILVELRIGAGDKGAQTVAPPSVHESGEDVRWEDTGEPARVDGDELMHMVRLVGACALMARYWPARDSHARHQAALVVGGFLSRCGLRRSSLREHVGAIAKAAGDEEWRDRRKAAEDAAVAHGAGKHTFGFTGLADMFGRDIAERISEWLGYSGDSETDERPRPNGAAAPEPPAKPDYKPLKGLLIYVSKWDAASPPEQDWGVFNRFAARQAAILSGEGGSGKSTTLLHLAAAHSLGADWLGAVLDKGPALLIECEDEERVLWRRLAAVCNHYQKTFAELERGGLYLMSLAGKDALLATTTRSGKIETTQRYKELLELAGDLKPKCIAIASSANVYAGSELDRSQVQQFINQLTEVAQVAGGYLVLAQHPSLTGINSDSGLSGSTQWHNAVRARAFMKGVSPAPDEQPRTDLRELIFKKNQYGDVAETIVLKWTSGLYLPLPGAPPLNKMAAERKADEVFFALLRRFNAQNRDLSATPSNVYAPAVFARHEEAAGLNSKQLAKAMQRLLDAKTIAVEVSGPPSRLRKRLVIT